MIPNILYSENDFLCNFMKNIGCKTRDVVISRISKRCYRDATATETVFLVYAQSDNCVNFSF